MIYAISDIHGNKQLFDKVVETIKTDKDYYLYILGDCIDRCDKGLEILESISNNNERMKLIIGNHEKFLLNYIINVNDIENRNQWVYNGGYKTLKQYDSCNCEKQKNILELLQSAPSMITVNANNEKNFILSHSGANWSDLVNPNFEAKNCISNRIHFLAYEDIPDGWYMVHGHTPDSNIPLPIIGNGFYNNNHKINLDCSTYISNTVRLLNLDTLEIQLITE